MTTINCSKSCKFQIDGKCCCDNVLIPLNEPSKFAELTCPYQTPAESKK